MKKNYTFYGLDARRVALDELDDLSGYLGGFTDFFPYQIEQINWNLRHFPLFSVEFAELCDIIDEQHAAARSRWCEWMKK